jgi:hypothetical protein
LRPAVRLADDICRAFTHAPGNGRAHSAGRASPPDAAASGSGPGAGQAGRAAAGAAAAAAAAAGALAASGAAHLKLADYLSQLHFTLKARLTSPEWASSRRVAAHRKREVRGRVAGGLGRERGMGGRILISKPNPHTPK